MTEEAEMSTLADDINKQIGAGRKSIERSLDEMKEMEMPKLPPAGLVAAGLVTAVGGGGGGGGGGFLGRGRGDPRGRVAGRPPRVGSGPAPPGAGPAERGG